MDSSNLKKAGILTLVLVLTSIGSWEFYLRSKGFNIAYDDGKELWSDKRAMVYEPINKATVFIGASRNKYALDIATWQSLTGDHPIQLAIEGTSPLPVFDDLANDKNFKGKVVFDVTEGTFFSNSSNIAEPKEDIDWFKKRTPAQRFSFILNHALESKLVFLDKYNFSLNALMNKLPVIKRKGLIDDPIFPTEFGRTTFERQEIMMDKFLTDTLLQNRVKAIWTFFGNVYKDVPLTGTRLDSMLMTMKNDADKIKERGGDVLFVRTPASGLLLEKGKIMFPREKYWERILSITGCPGIHFEDYPAIDHFICPEWSHLGRPDAIIFTKNIIKIMQAEKGWTFPHKQNSITLN